MENELTLKLLRHTFGETYTEGFLYANGVYLCDTLEPKNIDLNRSGDFDGDETKVWGKTAIPYGRYEIKIAHSPKFKRELPLLMNVPHFTGILIHAGNTPKDTAGCILVGSRSDAGVLRSSRDAESLITNYIRETIKKDIKVFIRVEDN